MKIMITLFQAQGRRNPLISFVPLLQLANQIKRDVHWRNQSAYLWHEVLFLRALKEGMQVGMRLWPMFLFLATRWSRSTSLRRLFFSPKLSFVKARVDVQTRLQQQMKLGDTKHLRFFVVCHTFLKDHKTIHSFWVLLVVLQKKIGFLMMLFSN